jgi:hypothetical protein
MSGSSSEFGTEEETVPVGECPVHGYVVGDDIEYAAPNPSYCNCGEKLERVTVATRNEVESHRS